MFALKLLIFFNGTVIHCEFSIELKKAAVTPIFKKDDPTKAKNCRPVSVIKVFQKFLRE